MQRLATSLSGVSAFAASSSSMLRRPQSATNESEIRSPLATSSYTSTNTTSVSSSAVEQRRGRFYTPTVNSGWNLFKMRFGAIRRPQQYWRYKHQPITPRPGPNSTVNKYWGTQRIAWNPIPSKIGIVNKKAEDWGYPERRPPPKGLRESAEFFPHFFDKYFPAEECRLVIDSVLNTESQRPVFHFPMHMSRREIWNYLKNIYGLDNIVSVKTRNIKGRFFKNEVGRIKSLPDYKEATVMLDAPVRVDFKQIKGTEDTPDNKKLT